VLFVAKPLLKTAISLYYSFNPANNLVPVWGKERSEKLPEQAK